MLLKHKTLPMARLFHYTGVARFLFCLTSWTAVQMCSSSYFSANQISFRGLRTTEEPVVCDTPTGAATSLALRFPGCQEAACLTTKNNGVKLLYRKTGPNTTTNVWCLWECRLVWDCLNLSSAMFLLVNDQRPGRNP